MMYNSRNIRFCGVLAIISSLSSISSSVDADVIAYKNTNIELYLSNSRGVVAILNNPEKERRAPFYAPNILSNHGEYKIFIECGAGGCVTALPNLTKILTSGANAKCISPIFGKLIFQRDHKLTGQLYIDQTGKCITFLGKSYLLKESLYKLLLESPVTNW